MSLGRRAELQALSLIMTKARILRAGHSRQKSFNRVGEIVTEVSNGRGASMSKSTRKSGQLRLSSFSSATR
jgi:hypothetical protein